MTPLDHAESETQSSAVERSLVSDHGVHDDPHNFVGGEISFDQPSAETRTSNVERNGGRDAIAIEAAQSSDHSRSVSPVTTELQLYSMLLDDLERLRIATENRIRAFECPPPTYQRQVEAPATYQEQLDALKSIEHQATLALQRAIRRHPLGVWIRATKGIGEKQGARLIAALDEPDWNFAEGRLRRGPAELWAYAGYHTILVEDHGDADFHHSSVLNGDAPARDHTRAESRRTGVSGGSIAARRRKGVKSNWNAAAKMRARLCAESCKRQRCATCTAVGKEKADGEGWTSPPPDCTCAEDGFVYRAIYDRARIAWFDRDTTDAHKENHALRIVAKAILKDLFLESRRLRRVRSATHAAGAEATR